MDFRTRSTTVTQTHREAGVAVSPPTTIVTATVVVDNPLAGKGLVQDLSSLEQIGNEAAKLLIDMATASLAAVGISATDVRGYGKGAIVGTDGDRRRYRHHSRNKESGGSRCAHHHADRKQGRSLGL